MGVSGEQSPDPTRKAWNNYKGLEPGTPTYDTYIEQAGYHVENIGRTDYLSGGHSVRARVDAWLRTARIMRPAYNDEAPRVIDEPKERVSAWDWEHTDNAVEWLRRHAGRIESPFKLYVGLSAPHLPFVTSRTYLGLIDEEKVTLPSLEEPAHPATRFQAHHKNWPHGFSEQIVRLVRRVYYAMVAEVDVLVGRLLSAVSELGLDDTTVVVFSSDHGELAMEHRQHYKMSPYEGSVRVPFIVKGPGMHVGKEVERPASLVDLYPTFMDLTGAEGPKTLDGFSLAEPLTGPVNDHPEWAISEFHGTTAPATWFQLRKGDWKYIHYAGYEPELFNLRSDPDEICNRASQAEVVRSELEVLLRRIVDPDEVDARSKAYDRRCFRQWREEQLRQGVYRDTMANIFSGNTRLRPDQIRSWTDGDEQQVLDWLSAE